MIRSNDDSDVVRAFDTVLLVFGDGTRQFAEVKSDSWVRIRKASFCGSALLGASYGTVFEIGDAPAGSGGGKRAALTPIADGALVPAIQLDLGSGADNRALIDSSDAQSMRALDVERMRAEGASGDAIIAALVGGSSTFASKTAFSQEKWLRKKALKYLPRVRVLRTTPLNVCETALAKHADRIAGLRADTLARMLATGDVRHGVLPLVFDNVSGLLLAAVAHRMGGRGTILAAHSDGPGGPQIGYLTKFNFGSQNGGAAPLRIVGVQYGRLATLAVSASDVAERLKSSSSNGAIFAALTGEERVIDGIELSAEVTSVNAVAPAVTSMVTELPPPRSESAVDNDFADVLVGAPSATIASAVVNTRENAGESRSNSGHISGIVSGPADAGGEVARKRRRNGRTVTPADPSQCNHHIVRPARVSEDERSALLLRGADCCLIATQSDPLPLVMLASRFLRPSSSLAVYCPEVEPLARVARALRTAGIAACVDVSETWTREYQVLPDRTHPTMNMHGASGFMLTAVTLATAYSVVEPPML